MFRIVFNASKKRMFRMSNFSTFSTATNGTETVSQKFVKNLPLVGVCIGSVALTFQLVILYPWHDELSEQFEELERYTIKLEKLTFALESRMNSIVAMEHEVKVKERRILDTAEEILAAEKSVSEKLEQIKANMKK